MVDHTKLKPPSLWRQEPNEPTLLLLGKLAEECNELAARATRCMIQGLRKCDPGTGRTNEDELQDEAADVLGLLNLTIDRLQLDMNHIAARAAAKAEHKEEWLRMVRDAIHRETGR